MGTSMRATGQHQAQRGRRPRLLRWVAYLMMIAGGAALGWCVGIMTDAQITQWLARERLASETSVATPSPLRKPTARPPVAVPAGTPLGELSIPRLGLSVVVLEGSDTQTLRRGLGHIETTPRPGESGNVAIAGHRDSFFRPLRNVQVGDDILLDTPGERAHYRVSSFRVVDPSEVSVIAPTSDAMLTLVTCYPFYFVGSAPDRFVVRATLVQD